MGDNRRVDMERGIVRGFDARSGDLLWSWDPIPRDPSDRMYATWSPEAAAVTGGGNAWAPLSVDEERGLVFLPTGSAAPDFYGGQRPGDNRYANSVVALRASTGEVVWHFQVVHHDVWDYDVPAQVLSATQPFPLLPEPLHPFGFSPDDRRGAPVGGNERDATPVLGAPPGARER